MPRPAHYASVIAAVFTLIAIFSGPACNNAAAPKELKKVTISQAFQHLLYIGLYVAKEEKFFEQQGLDVNIQTAGGDAQAFSALTGGKADFAQGDPAFVAIAHEKGWEGKVIVMAVDRVAIWGVTFDTTIASFTDPKGFKGKTVATYPEPNTSYVVQKELAQRAGLTLGKDVKILQVPFGSEIASLKNGQANIAQTIEPNATQVEQQGGKIVFSYPDAWGPLAFTGVMVSQKMIDGDPGTVQKFVNAYEQSFQFIQNNFDSTVAIAQKYLPDLKREIIATALKRLITSGSIPAHAAINPQSWKALLDIRVQVGDLKAMPSVELYDNSFAQKAAEK
jgi:NitT/TauT family transport system substrate-binding protein